MTGAFNFTLPREDLVELDVGGRDSAQDFHTF